MQLLTKNTDYAIRALIYLARNDERYVSSREISKKDRIPLPYLRRVLQQLRREKIITAREGARGGVRLAKPPEVIGVTHLMELFQGKIELVKCVFRRTVCHNRRTCVLRKRLKRIEENVVAELKDITIGSLVDDINKQVSEKVYSGVIARNKVTKQSLNSRTKTRLLRPAGSQ